MSIFIKLLDLYYCALIYNGLSFTVWIKVNNAEVETIRKDFETAFVELKENSDITYDHGVPADDLESYLNHLFDSYKSMGVTKGDRTKWNAINFREKYASNFDHFDYPDKKDNIFRYCFGLIAIVKSADQKTVSCYRGIYSLNFKLEESMLIKNGPITRKSILWGLLKWSKTETTETREMKMIKTKDQERLNNFLQFKALSMFERKGFLERISYMECQK